MDDTSPQQKINQTTRDTLNAVSLSFCLAKWLQTTLHLHRGLTHSCHHPNPHEIPLTEIATNVAALHNTQEKIASRAQMLRGDRPGGCQYCWNIEDLGPQAFSDRVLKSKDDWAMPHLAEVLKNPLSDKILPRYLEISFSRNCNFKCSYCSPAFSTRWAQEVSQFGPLPGRADDQGSSMLEDRFEEETNPYIHAFWQWWPNLKNALHTLRITGGEPLLSPNTYKIMDRLKEDPAPELAFTLNSNLGVAQEKIYKLIQSIDPLLQNKKIKKFEIYTSMEAHGKQAEYIRHGLDTELFWSNVNLLLEKLPQIRIHVMVTFNALSLTSFLPFLERVLELRKKYNNEFHSARLLLDISYLHHPSFFAVPMLPPHYQTYVQKFVDFIDENRAKKNSNSWGFFDFEYFKMLRTLEWMKIPPTPLRLYKERICFYQYFNEYDRRRGTNFLATFPEMAELWEECKKLAARETSPQVDEEARALLQPSL